MGFYEFSTRAIIGNIDSAAYAIIFSILAAASVVDIRERRIPDSMVIAGVMLGLTLKLYYPKDGFIDGLIGGATAGFVLLLIYLITKGGLGLGDVKLFGCTGVYLGLEKTISAMLIAALISGLFSLMLICINRENKKLELPFAPFIMAGALAAVML